MKNPSSYTSTLSVKVPLEFEAQLRAAAAERGEDISAVLREMLGIRTLPAQVLGSSPRQSNKLASGKLKHRIRRPKRLAAPSGSDPVVVHLLASVANGLLQTAEAIAGNHKMVAPADVANLLFVLQTMDDRLGQLMEHEDRKSAH